MKTTDQRKDAENAEARGELKSYRVFGQAFVPVECEAMLQAFSAEEALAKARLIWDQCPMTRQSFIVSGSQDYAAAQKFKPNSAKLCAPPRLSVKSEPDGQSEKKGGRTAT